ncbi:hypothetical protein BaRGS_00017137, partial [Batillaria attramentaria]
HAQQDRTREPDTGGSALVEATLAQLHDACIYPDYNLFLRRLAFVDQAMFQRTKTEAARLTQQYNDIRDKFGIDWNTVTWTDLRKPLYSALAAAMCLILEGAPSNVPIGIDAQAAYWLAEYHQGQPSLTTQDFTAPVKTLQQTCARTEDLDLVFLIDTSSSVGPSEWSAEQKFVSDIIIGLSVHNGIGPKQDRVAMVTFSDDARLAFDLDTGSDLVTALNKVLNKARAGAAKAVVLVTDGRADDRVATVLSVMPLKLTDVTIFTVGVGSHVNPTELAQFASDPACSHTYHQYTYPCGFNVLAQLQGGSVGTSVTVSVDHGRTEVYGSYTTQLPSQDVHDLNKAATSTSPAVIFTRDPRPLTLSLETEHAQGLLCNGNFTIRVDSHAAKRTDCIARRPDLVFLLDATLAQTDAQWTAMLDFVQNFVQQFDVGPQAAQVALVSYTDHPTTHFSLGQLNTATQVLQVLRIIPRNQGTTSSLPVALTYVANQILAPGRGARVDASKTVVLVTPGTPSDPLNAVGQAAMLHNMGVRIVTVAVGNSFDDVNLNAISSGPQHVEKVSDVTGLSSLVGKVTQEACGEVKVMCVEGGLSRACSIEDLLASQYGSMLGPDRNVPSDPCTLQLATGTVHVNRFPHPTDRDKFLLCDSNGQAYVVLCPLGEMYNPAARECHNSTVVATAGIAVFTTTTARDRTQYYHCDGFGGSKLEKCPPRKVWYQIIQQCVWPSVIVDKNSNRMDPGLPNPCTRGRGFFPAPIDRSSYIQCNQYHEAYLQKCPPGQVWKQIFHACDRP